MLDLTPPYTESTTNLSALAPLLTINFSVLVSLTAEICTNSPVASGHDGPALILR